MTEQLRIPDAETRKREIEQIRAANRQLEEASLALEELLAMIEADLRKQRRKRIQAKSQVKLHK
jgi:hypothetical protein